jgi:hypothetical protein
MKMRKRGRPFEKVVAVLLGDGAARGERTRDAREFMDPNGLGQRVIQGIEEMFSRFRGRRDREVGDLAAGVNSGVGASARHDRDLLLKGRCDGFGDEFFDARGDTGSGFLASLLLPSAEVRAIIGDSDGVALAHEEEKPPKERSPAGGGGRTPGFP